jgi:hypothetical protein
MSDINATISMASGQNSQVLPSLVSFSSQPRHGTAPGKSAAREVAVAEDMQDLVSDEQHSQGLVLYHSIAQYASCESHPSTWQFNLTCGFARVWCTEQAYSM